MKIDGTDKSNISKGKTVDKSNISSRKTKDRVFQIFIGTITCLAVIILLWLFFDIIKNGFRWLSIRFLLSYPSRFPSKAGVITGLIGSFYIIGLTVIFSLPIGLGAAVYLEEYARDSGFARFIKINISNLAGTPSIVYGLLGLALFVNALGFKRSILSGALTMSLVILPIVIVSSQEAIKAVPQFLRYGSYALGATKWQTIKKIVIPTALPGILTGIILSVSRALGETAPLAMVGAFASSWALPKSIMDTFSALPVLIYDWTGRPQADFKGVAAAAIIVLLIMLLLINSAAIIIRNKFQKNIE